MAKKSSDRETQKGVTFRDHLPRRWGRSRGLLFSKATIRVEIRVMERDTSEAIPVRP